MNEYDLIADLKTHLAGYGQVSLVETSKSWVFLTDDTVFKLKKRVRDDLQDLTSLRARHDNTLTEIDLNRRLAPDMYLGPVRVGRRADGSVVLDDTKAPTVDWMVKMRRLPASRMLDVQIAAGGSKTALARDIDTLVPVLAAFYRKSENTRLTGADLMTVQEDQLQLAHVVLLHPCFAAHHDRFRQILDALIQALPVLAETLTQRVRDGAVVACHGDLRPEHICLLDRPVIYDCLEFNRILRLTDPFSEVVFLGMECAMRGADWIGPRLIAGLERDFGTAPDAGLLQIYEASHAITRARLSLAHLLQPAPRTPEKWMPLALRYLNIAEQRLCQREGACNHV